MAAILFFSFFFIHVAFPATRAHTGGFSVDLIHRDSPNSPFYNPSATTLDRLKGSFRRSISRANHFKTEFDVRPDDIQSEIIPASGEYLMKLSIGTPPVEILAVADTGSDLTWTQCQPCPDCYNQTAPLFDPKESSTYKDFSCLSKACIASKISSGCGDDNTCRYQVTYGDQSFSLGNLAAETFTFGSTTGRRPVSLPTVTFGCGHNDGGTFNESASGIIGLGGGPVSIIRQLSGSVRGKFSYCLIGLDADPKSTSTINFGDSAVVSGAGVVSTPIVKKSVDTFYYLTLESVGLGNTTLPFISKKSVYSNPAAAEEEGNIIIDSGTTLTLLPSDFYESLEGELKKAIHGDPTEDPEGLFGLCYESGSVNIGNLPTITFSFAGGADLELPPSSTFVQAGELVCLGIVPVDELAIFGNLSQMNFLVGYDLVKSLVSFKPTDCTKP